MNIAHFYSIIQDENTEVNISEIEKLSHQYPYFSVSQMLCISFLYRNNDNNFAAELKKFSHNIPDRKYLFQQLKKSILSSNLKHSPETIQTIQDHTQKLNTEISAPDISKELNKSISESIVQTELLKIDASVKNKAVEISHQQETPLQQQSKDTEPEPQPALQNTAQELTNEQSDTLPPDSLSYLLKQFIQKDKADKNKQTSDTATEPDFSDKKEKIKHQQEIIDKVLSNLPKSGKIVLSEKKFYSAENKAKESLLETEDLVTETLAQIYASQGNIHKAIRAYEILSLKFPQKITYFAAKIQELKNQLRK